MRKTIAILLSGFMLFSTNVFAETKTCDYMESSYYSTIVPYYTGIVSANNNLNISSSGSAECYAKTQTDSGYDAKVKIELQQKDGSWSTIKSWSNTNDMVAILSKSYSVSKGYSYRLKTTHYCLDKSGKTISSLNMYSNTVEY